MASDYFRNAKVIPKTRPQRPDATAAHTLRYTSSMPAAVTTTSGATPATTPAVPVPPPGGFGRLWRALKQLFHELTGAIFAILAFAWLNNAFRAWTRDTAYWLIALAVIVAAIFMFFAISSFRRARKI
jgi:hypothetical protein